MLFFTFLILLREIHEFLPGDLLDIQNEKKHAYFGTESSIIFFTLTKSMMEYAV